MPRHVLTQEERKKLSPLNRAESKGGLKLPKPPPRPRKGKGKLARTKNGPNRMKNANGGVACGAKKRDGGACTLAAGWGTNHPGIGCCKFHGGSMPNHIKAAAKEGYRQLFGTPMEINPLEALMWCIRIRAGEVKWLGDRMAELDEKSWVEETIVGKQFHLYARERQKAMNDLARFSQQAIALGIAERAVKMAETYADLLARLIQGILGDLDLTPEQRAKAPMIVRKHLIAIDGGKPMAELEAAK